MRATTILLSTLPTHLLAQQTDLAASLSSQAAALQSSLTAEAASMESNTASLKSQASAEIFSLTHCDPSFASWYHSITSVLSTETNQASISALESSIKSNPPHEATCVTASTTLSMSTVTSMAVSGASASEAGAASATADAAASATSSTSSGDAMMLVPGVGFGAAVLGLAAWL